MPAIYVVNVVTKKFNSRAPHHHYPASVSMQTSARGHHSATRKTPHLFRDKQAGACRLLTLRGRWAGFRLGLGTVGHVGRDICVLSFLACVHWQRRVVERGLCRPGQVAQAIDGWDIRGCKLQRVDGWGDVGGHRFRRGFQRGLDIAGFREVCGYRWSWYGGGLCGLVDGRCGDAGEGRGREVTGVYLEAGSAGRDE
jgi:hypothetical protein